MTGAADAFWTLHDTKRRVEIEFWFRLVVWFYSSAPRQQASPNAENTDTRVRAHKRRIHGHVSPFTVWGVVILILRFWLEFA